MFRPRPNTFSPYRLILALILLTIGFGVAIYGYLISNHPEWVSWLPHIRPDAGLPLVFSGVITVSFGIGQLHLVLERRRHSKDRRQHRDAIDFPNRRSGIDRRTGKPCE